MVCKHCSGPIREVNLLAGKKDYIHADGMMTHEAVPAEPSTAPAAETIFNMRLVLPIDGQRTGISRMVHACADIISHLGDNGLADQRKRYVKDPYLLDDTVIGEWSLGPEPDPVGTATYAFSAREITTMLHALRIVQEIREASKTSQSPIVLHGCYHEETCAMTLASLNNACDHFAEGYRPLDNDELESLCNRLNPLDALMR